MTILAESDDWKQLYRRPLDESILHPGPQNQMERDKWVVRRLLEVLRISFDETELVAREGQDVDVEFRTARFQIKELMQDEYKRGDDLRQQRKRLDEAQSPRDLVTTFIPKRISITEIVALVEEKAKGLAKGEYGPQECASLDLVFYFNYRNHIVRPPFNESITDGAGFRSVSVVTNRYCAVLYADRAAPHFLRSNCGKVCYPLDL